MTPILSCNTFVPRRSGVAAAAAAHPGGRSAPLAPRSLRRLRREIGHPEPHSP
ncbi:hypothetical protein [Ramlibacter sp.]|uniref:hypothetical protein n=1 Tax=Ramlibacter sp. TaxID=1917967 RepID=UPI002B719F2B|nr:hypothetical protein [Ramlibacter sp.]HWI83567.1 hypothetical protein [Ramlibacter sp.]